LARFKQVQTLLRQWRLRAIAYARPGYEEAVQDALQNRTEMTAQLREDGLIVTTPGMGSFVAPKKAPKND
jgi:hypothetical protein